MNTVIEHISTLLPPYSYTNDEVIEYAKKWLSGFSENRLEKAVSVFNHTNIRKRHTIIPLSELFSPRSLDDFSFQYRKNAIELGIKAVEGMLDKHSISPKSIDMVISTSCTGFMIPSFDLSVAEALSFRNNIKRLPVTQMGCVAGVSALIYADDYLKAYPDDTVLIISLEFPSNTIQLENRSWDNIVATALFGDGIACYLLRRKSRGFAILDTDMVNIPNSQDMLGYNLCNNGLVMNLSKQLPNVIKDNFEDIILPILNRNGLTRDKLDRFLVHPGGIKIIAELEKLLEEYGLSATESRTIMENFGNMSSATIGFVIEAYLNSRPKPNENVLVTGFGPGVSAHQLLMTCL